MAPKGLSLPTSPTPYPDMANLSLREREQAITLRPAPGHPYHKTFLRVHLHRQTLANLQLKAGELCHISVPKTHKPVIGDVTTVMELYPAIAWLTTDGQLGGNKAQVSEGWRMLSGTTLESKGLLLGRYIGDNGDASEVVIKEVGDSGDVWQTEGRGWVPMLENALFEGKYVFEGMPLRSVEYKGVKRDFEITRVVPADAQRASTVSPCQRRIISAYKVTFTTAVDLAGMEIIEASIPEVSAQKSEVNGRGETPGPAESPLHTDPPNPAPLPAFAQIAGLTIQLAKLKSLLLSTLYYSHRFTSVNLTPFRGILLYGPPGTGKSLIMRCLPGELSSSLPRPLSTFSISSSVIGKYLGESEASIRKIFSDAKTNKPSVIFIDDVDSLAPKRSLSGELSDARLVATLMAELDELGDGIVVVAATSNPNNIDEGLRRPGRLEQEIEIPRPDMKAREEILSLLLSKVPKGWVEQSEEGDIQGNKVVNRDPVIKSLAFHTHGFVGADLEALVRGSVLHAISRLETLSLPTSSETLASQDTILESDLERSLKEVRPTSMKEVFLDTPNVRWSDVGGQAELKQRLRETVEWPLTCPEVFTRLGCTPRKGLLLYGPPGCSKTLVAKALATEAGLNFITVKGPELLNMYVGESERAVREVFRKARAASPSIIFFDEIDALGSSRTRSGEHNGVNVLTALLNEMDGIEVLHGVIVLAATNRPDILDLALLRPGRLDTILYVGPPDLPARREILQIRSKRMVISPDVDLGQLAIDTEGYSGAELVHLCDEASHYAMRESLQIESVAWRHFEEAKRHSTRQITDEMRKFYEDWRVGGVNRL
ncbi:P-loop containing nucleoside triphosphate hydrolase protein [Terfezia claveryi]|nr:P-loop containing nucleoside triphosphate hydrolase protein [Terfezia claveryi]